MKKDSNYRVEEILMRAISKLSGSPDEETIYRYLGKHEACYLGYAAQEEIRKHAASGGIVTAILIYLLDKKNIQGALISKIVIKDKRIEAEPFIARNRDDILSGQSSIYMEFPFFGAYRQLKQADGNLAVVALPCYMSNLHRFEDRDPVLHNKIKLRIGLICARSSNKNLLKRVLRDKGIQEEDVAQFRFRQGHWRGHMQVQTRDEQPLKFPFQDFSIYRNLHFECETKCLHCEDPLGEYADIVCGDAWLPELKNHPIKHSLVIARTTDAAKLIDRMIEEGYLKMDRISPATVFDAQRRTIIPMKRGKPAKKKLSPLFGYKMTYAGSWHSHWNDYLVSTMILANYRLSQSKRLNKYIYMIPKPFLRVYLMIMSFLKNF